MSRYTPRIDRRTALKWLSAAAATTLVAPKMVRAATYIKTPKGYGTDPDMLNPTSPWDRIMTDGQLQVTAVMTDIILPEEPPHPSPSQIGVPDFVNEWVSSPYEKTQDDKTTVLNGIDWIDTEAKTRFGKGFADCAADEQLLLMTEISRPTHDRHDFFTRFRALTLGGYYTTPAGFKDIGYIGNVMKAKLDERLKAIGV